VCVDAVDASGDEGLIAAARTTEELGCPAAFVTTGLLLREDGDVRLHAVPPDVLDAQLADVLSPGATPVVRTGVLGGGQGVERVVSALERAPEARLVVAPVARIGKRSLLDHEAVAKIRIALFARARVVVLRVAESARWGAPEIRSASDLRTAAAALREQGARAALVSGWIDRGRVMDLLDDGGTLTMLDTTRLAAPRVPGLSAAHATALAVRLAAGEDLPAAAYAAQRYVGSRLRRVR
jgi:hydroxymethylpyrimidine kinase/phosphomethylpyrimidine kinase